MDRLLKGLEDGTRTFIKSPVLVFGAMGLMVAFKVISDRRARDR
ncbi:Hypothetical Protein RradSPS_0807 [Rubrobacter radiotolerans]|uniref:Uncharacterized protein n=1 Tax=Rubrobacter radiotolerans TaxID=42256 RepID=A0A023X280_RUBRA|nr:hypothetical protein [Rubrobacter radiotolerans]AHY46090.1 Hypothetical Protein RradSPS_0807 [Rubrobacter radiotolerans]MDX5893500.1 hypothetical protein [Rubrobacter radiotolerans]SMC03860.1 hypothetical protein SAMN00767673_0806 [Rubrobacter radiotolerans DSM 5868]